MFLGALFGKGSPDGYTPTRTRSQTFLARQLRRRAAGSQCNCHSKDGDHRSITALPAVSA